MPTFTFETEPPEIWPRTGASRDGRLECREGDCTYRAGGMQVAIVRNARILPAACGGTDLVVATVSIRAVCRRMTGRTIDRYDLLDRTTDVLSFPYEEPDLFGELYIDPVLAAEQALRYRHSLHREMRRLIVHGCLHLCGHDHMTTTQRRNMRALENQYDPAGEAE